MKHSLENTDELVLYYYREVDDPRRIADHLASCDECREHYEQLQTDLQTIDELPLPDRGPAYASEVWLRLRPHLVRAPRPRPVWHRDWGRAAAVAAAVVLAFFLGRMWPTQQTTPAGDTSQRIFLAAVSDHLERSQLLLTEIANSSPDNTFDLGLGIDQASRLLVDNRLYRTTAQHHHEPRIAQLLDELERALLEISHATPQLSPSELEYLQRRIEAQGLLFKARVVRSQLEAQARHGAPAAGDSGKSTRNVKTT